MPVHKSSDYKGSFYQYGSQGKKYYFKTPKEEKEAQNKAKAQGRAIKISQLMNK